MRENRESVNNSQVSQPINMVTYHTEITPFSSITCTYPSWIPFSSTIIQKSPEFYDGAKSSTQPSRSSHYTERRYNNGSLKSSSYPSCIEEDKNDFMQSNSQSNFMTSCPPPMNPSLNK